MKQYIVLLGNYGSGKTELALNLAVNAAKNQQRTALIDLDIINPYFRSAEKKQFLSDHDVTLMASNFVRTGIDLPLVPSDVSAVFSDQFDYVVFDVGGDVVGATALGSLNDFFEQLGESLQVYYVVNIRRPFSSTVDRISTMFWQIQKAARIPIQGLINNANLADQTTAQDIVDGQVMLQEVAEKLGIPIVYTSGREEILQEASSMIELSGQRLPITTLMRPEWMEA